MKNETETKHALEKIELDFKHYLENYKGVDNSIKHNEKIKFFEDTIRAIKFILEMEL